MTKNFLICAPTSHLYDLRARWQRGLQYAVVMDGENPLGVVPSALVWNQSELDRNDPECVAEKLQLTISRCSEQDSLGYVGAKILKDRAFAALVYEGETLVGVAELLDVLQSLLWNSSRLTPLLTDRRY